ncbi:MULTISPECIES: hypothetical protein [unclassified Sphingobium]|uniref:hypothetical protein n=1 Tax=unclassified Sphingobium TaxID=2611147 RepID=UPI00128FDB99|nr:MULTISPECIES: hypothetical protein [unclassified Sphingobium]
MQKNDLSAQIENAKNNFILGLAGASLLTNPNSVPLLQQASCSFGGMSVNFGQVATMMQNAVDRNIAIKEYIMSHFRAAIKETFELIKSYCTITNQSEKFKSANNYHIWRLVRNSISHDARWEFNNNDLQRLPLSWNGVKLDASLQGKHFEINLFGYEGLYALRAEMDDFAATALA